MTRHEAQCTYAGQHQRVGVRLRHRRGGVQVGRRVGDGESATLAANHGRVAPVNIRRCRIDTLAATLRAQYGGMRAPTDLNRAADEAGVAHGRHIARQHAAADLGVAEGSDATDVCITNRSEVAENASTGADGRHVT